LSEDQGRVTCCWVIRYVYSHEDLILSDGVGDVGEACAEGASAWSCQARASLSLLLPTTFNLTVKKVTDRAGADGETVVVRAGLTV